MITVKRKVSFSRGNSGRREITDPSPPATVSPTGRIPRISKLMALAIRFEGLLRAGKISDQTELARLAKVTQPRMTQIMNLLHLAPDIQEAILFLPRVEAGPDPIHLKQLRRFAMLADWREQRHAWTQLGVEEQP